MGFLSAVKELLHTEQSREIHRWSFIFIDTLDRFVRYKKSDVRIFEQYKSDGWGRAENHWRKSDGFDYQVSLYFSFDEDIFSIEAVKFYSQKQRDAFETHRLHPLIASSSPVYCIESVPDTRRKVSSEEIKTSLLEIFSKFVFFRRMPRSQDGEIDYNQFRNNGAGWTKLPPPYPATISTPLGLASLCEIPRLVI
jgi:hypothetical protein